MPQRLKTGNGDGAAIEKAMRMFLDKVGFKAMLSSFRILPLTLQFGMPLKYRIGDSDFE